MCYPMWFLLFSTSKNTPFITFVPNSIFILLQLLTCSSIHYSMPASVVGLSPSTTILNNSNLFFQGFTGDLPLRSGHFFIKIVFSEHRIGQMRFVHLGFYFILFYFFGKLVRLSNCSNTSAIKKSTQRKISTQTLGLARLSLLL